MRRKILKLLVFITLVFILSWVHLLLLKTGGSSVRFLGVVIDDVGRPIEGATVRLQGTAFLGYTDSKGRFYLHVDEDIKSENITAWKTGYYNWGTPLSPGEKEYRIELKPIVTKDNPQYRWITSFSKGDDSYLRENFKDVKPCEKCHPEIVSEWAQNAHAQAAKNPVFLAFFNGRKGPDGKGIGYKYDFPNSNGNCAACHVPAAAMVNPFDVDPSDVTGVPSEGVFCDFCHKIKSASVDNTGGFPGILSYEFLRPEEGFQVFYGPYDDITSVKRSSGNPEYKESSYCAPCHNVKFWDNLVYSEYSEWEQSSYARRNITCQNCHMPATGKMEYFTTPESGGISRDPMSIPSHLQLGVRHEDFMRETIELDAKGEMDGETLKVTVAIRNTGAGHHYPTGSPMRNMILLVNAIDKNGNPLTFVEGETVPKWGGEGDIAEGNYAGLPGKGFAKIFKDIPPYPGPRRVRHFSQVYPAPYWRPAIIDYDNRIPADGVDTSIYVFDDLKENRFPVIIENCLIYRRTYKSWQNIMDMQIPDLELSRERIYVERNDFQ